MRKEYKLATQQYDPNCFCITTTEANNDISIKEYEWAPVDDAANYPLLKEEVSFNSYNIEYSLDKQNWLAYTNNTIISLPNINDKVYFRGINMNLAKASSYNWGQYEASVVKKVNYMTFKSTKKCNLSGFVMSLFKLYSWNNTPGFGLYDGKLGSSWHKKQGTGQGTETYILAYHLCSAFEELKIVDASQLEFYKQYGPINGSYISASSLFHDQEYLINIPSISRYTGYTDFMFANCINLEKLPRLSVSYNSDGMFYNCSKIKVSETQTGEYINEYIAPNAQYNDYLEYMFNNTGGTYTGNGIKNTTYYTSNEVK